MEINMAYYIKIFTAIACLSTIVAMADGCGSKMIWQAGCRNFTGKDVDNVRIDFGGFSARFGILVSGKEHQSVIGLFTQPIPSEASLHWISQDGQAHKMVVKLDHGSAKEFSGIVWFNIRPDNSVEVEFEKAGGS
jgi:hypothetical protein